MAVYPQIPAGRRLTDVLLESMLPIFAVKAVTEPLASSIAMQNDDELLAAVAANATYDVTLKLLYDCATAADIVIGWSGPAGATMNWATIGAHIGVTSSGTVTDLSMQSRLITEVQDLGGGASTGTVAWVTGTLLTAGTAGNLNFRWSQRVSNATATNVRAGSSLWLRRTA